ncbi:MAG: hypothetical protein COB98_08970 [Flavobacteriaceae bacterium]|nr:MAG: hypothetical protein COB98_08970 [Flavobacteriaceae bacterium]
MKTNLKGILTLLLALIVQFTFAQEREITGTVSDETGPLPGVSVIIKGSNTGVETDFNGHYSIKTKEGDVLMFSFLGMDKKFITVKNTNKINVTLTGGNILDEIIISGVAGGTSRKKLSVSVAKVSSEQLQDVPATSAAGALQGKVAGIKVTNFGQPGAGSTIVLRGTKNLFGSQSPLILMDGVIVEGGLNDVNVNDIESYEIVKGASASALYGSRAGNGVIVITTKRGKGLEKTQITVRSEIGFSSINKKINLNKSHGFNLASDWKSTQGIYTKYEGVTYPDNYKGGRNSDISGGRTAATDGYWDNPYGVYYDSQNEFFKTGFNKTIFTSIADQSDKSNVYFSAENSIDEGVLVETDGYSRTNLRINADYRFNDWLTFSTSNLFAKTNNKTPGGGGGVFFSIVLTDPDVNLQQENSDGQPYNYLPNQWSATVSNPLYNLWKNERERKKQRFLGAYNLKLKFADWVNLETEYSFESINNKYTNYAPYDSWTPSGGGLAYSEGSLFKSSSNTLAQKFQSTFNFSKSWTNLNIKGKLSYLMEDSQYEYFDVFGNNFKYKDLPTLNNFDPADISASSKIEDERAQNVFAIIGLDIKDRYLLDGMYRYDGSSLFGKNQRWAPYYRVSGAYRISEDFKIKGIQELKIHAALGTAGQRPGYNWQYEGTNVNNGVLSTNRTKGNPDLKPSKTTELEIGLNASFLDRFNLEVVYSKAETDDQFMLVDIFAPANEGKNKQWQNVGSVNFRTIEATLGVKAIETTNFNWNLNFTFDTSSNEITKLDVAERKVGPNDMFLIKEGEEFGSMFGRSFVKNLDQMSNQLTDGETIADYSINSDGVVVKTANIGTKDEAPIIVVDEDDVAVISKIGNQNADFKLGVFSNMKYKNFTFTMLWDYSKGGDIYNRQNQWLTRDYRHEMVDQAGKAAADKKTGSYYQGLYDVNNNNAFWVEDATYLKLREVSLSYTLREDVLANVAGGFFDSIKFSATGRNLLTFTDYTGWDPEVLQYDNETQQYFAEDLNIYPNTRAYNFSVQLKF